MWGIAAARAERGAPSIGCISAAVSAIDARALLEGDTRTRIESFLSAEVPSRAIDVLAVASAGRGRFLDRELGRGPWLRRRCVSDPSSTDALEAPHTSSSHPRWGI